ncbi:uncharacterized protein N7482_009726 [Penicillium canariense]|uniref:Myb-like domain-containing protein n=1 Tax=Penicillium canariense TaxID=189055 RepID=A0A9W9LG49_9EURO|nr:uncharacterized protein N7482_009726 [Penicillium canariense]KAJ5153248.1 hypothetical protein N7482_009726 [Penicillium canariense]
MDSTGALRPLDESLLRELPQLSLRIAPLREPVSSRTLSIPSPLEPNASGTRETSTISKTSVGGGNLPSNTKAGLPTVKEFLNAARTKTAEPISTDSQSNVEPPPKPILPAFVNLRALERFPFSSSFDDDALHGQRKRRRLDLQAESFSEHLQLPIPQAQKEHRPPPFGPFAILNGLNEPPPNAALLPPIEAGSSISQLLTKPSKRDGAAVDPSNSVSTNATIAESPTVERREGRIEELLDATLDDDDNDDDVDHDHDVVQRTTRSDFPEASKQDRENGVLENRKTTPFSAPTGDEPLSPKSRGRSRKNLRKWTDEETTDLLRGVVKCGIGNWTAILSQPELKFNKRTASNLKDRFRVCCPWAYRASDPNEATKQLRDNLANTLLKAQAECLDSKPGKIHLPNLNPVHTGSEPSPSPGSPPSSSHKPSTLSMPSATPETDHGSLSTPQQGYPSGKSASTASDKSQKNLASLGIPEAHITIKSKRRSRRPFTTAEDEALLKGYAVHGFQWTLIQQDKRLDLGHRRATDLRDRFRTKFPHAYRDGGSVSGKTANSQTPSQSPGAGRSGSPQDRILSNEPTPTKPQSSSPRRPKAHSRRPSSISNANAGPLDPAFLPPPQGFLESSANMVPAALSFPLEDNPTAAASSPWEDNTLAPMVWDDLG